MQLADGMTVNGVVNVSLLALIALVGVLLAGASRVRRQLRQSEAERSQALQEQALLLQDRDRLEAETVKQREDTQRIREELERWREDYQALQVRFSRLEAELAGAGERRRELEAERERLSEAQSQLSQSLEEEKVNARELRVTLEEERKTTREKLELLERNREALKQEFENLANRIFEQKNQSFSEQTRQNLDTLLTPFREQLGDFRKRVEDVYVTETRDRQALRSEIKSLQELNRQITEEAASLTKALRGDKKIQGNWGELILEKVLERSGLRRGVEYEPQGSYRDEDRQLLRPDVVVHLPDQRNVVIDSKVSLEAYQAYVSADEEAERVRALDQHVEAVRNHIRTLSDKDYSQLNGLHSPDFVLMFMPIEPAFVAAFAHDDRLFAEAFDRKVVVVTPTTLLATLRTVENIWRYERQSQNARKIAERAGAVYDKLRVFVESMEKFGNQLQTLHGTYDSAMNTLTRGRGNLVAQASRFVELGVRVRKELPRSVLDQAEVDWQEEGESSREVFGNGGDTSSAPETMAGTEDAPDQSE